MSSPIVRTLSDENIRLVSLWRTFERECNQFVPVEIVLAFCRALFEKERAKDPAEEYLAKTVSMQHDEIVWLLKKLKAHNEAGWKEFFQVFAEGYVPKESANSTVPGWKLVPIELTEEMAEAWNSSKADQIAFDDADNRNNDTRDAWIYRNAKADWAAMLAAAPTEAKSEPSKAEYK